MSTKKEFGKKIMSIALALFMVIALVGLISFVNPAKAEAAAEVKFAAVGKVDASEKLAKVLFQDGTSRTVKFVGDAPKEGALHTYVLEGEIYTFTYIKGNHNNSDQLTADQQWGFGVASWGGFWDAIPNYYSPADPSTMPIFVRYSATAWRVFPISKYVVAADNHPTNGYLFTNGVGTGTAEDHFKLSAFLIGGYNADGFVKPTAAELTPYGGATVAEGDVDLSVIDKDAPVVTVKETGICAVGEVSDEKVAYLKGDGKVQVSKLAGAKPQSGELYTYTLMSDGTCTFALAPLNPWAPTTNPNPANAEAWILSSQNNDEHKHEMLGGDAVYRKSTDDSVFFVRYSETSWRVFKGKEAIKTDGVNVMCYIAQTDDASPAIKYMLIGNYKDKKIVPATAEWSSAFDAAGKGWDKGNISVKFNSTGGNENPQNGEKSNVAVTSIVVLSVVACLALVFSKVKKQTI